MLGAAQNSKMRPKMISRPEFCKVFGAILAGFSMTFQTIFQVMRAQRASERSERSERSDVTPDTTRGRRKLRTNNALPVPY